VTLSPPHVDVVLPGPANATELTENLDALDRVTFSPEEATWMRDYGARVHG
jgi:aryl-alcohol dehydrogenase-like predicted oxidoreductase